MNCKAKSKMCLWLGPNFQAEWAGRKNKSRSSKDALLQPTEGEQKLKVSPGTGLKQGKAQEISTY